MAPSTRRSPPLQKKPPAPRTTTAPTVSSASMASHNDASSPDISTSIALRRRALFRVSRATPSAISSSTGSDNANPLMTHVQRPVDTDDLPAHERHLGRHQECQHPRDLVRLPHPPHRHVPHDRLP